MEKDKRQQLLIAERMLASTLELYTKGVFQEEHLLNAAENVLYLLKTANRGK